MHFRRAVDLTLAHTSLEWQAAQNVLYSMGSAMITALLMTAMCGDFP